MSVHRNRFFGETDADRQTDGNTDGAAQIVV